MQITPIKLPLQNQLPLPSAPFSASEIIRGVADNAMEETLKLPQQIGVDTFNVSPIKLKNPLTTQNNALNDKDTINNVVNSYNAKNGTNIQTIAASVKDAAKKGLSTKQKVGIGVAVAAVVAVGGFFINKFAKAKKEQTNVQQ